MRESLSRNSYLSKRNFVIFDVATAGVGRGASAAARLSAAAAARRGTAAALLRAHGDAFDPAAARAVDELHLGGVDFERLARLALAVGPLLDVEAPLDVDLAPLRQVPRDVLGLLAPGRDAEPGGDVLLLARLVAPPLVRRHRELTDRRALWGVAQFGVAPEITDQDDFVVGHVSRSVRLPAPRRTRARRCCKYGTSYHT